MSIYKDPKSPYWQYEFQIDGHRFRGSTRQTSKTQAREVEQLKKLERKAGRKDRSAVKLDIALETYWLEVAQDQPSAATTTYQLVNLNHGLGKDNLLSEISKSDIARYVATRRAKVSNASVNRETQLARRVWRYAATRLNADVSEIDWSDLMLREPKQRIRELSDDEEARLFATIRPDYQDCIRFCLLLGPRKSSGIGLLWKNTDLERSEARLRLKGGGEHIIPLTPSMVALIASQPRVGPFVWTYLCIRNSKGRRRGERYPITVSGLRRVWESSLRQAAIEDFRFHDLRHTAATRMVRATGNLAATQDLLGHTNVQTTMRYAHVKKDDVRNALLKVEADSTQTPGKSPGARSNTH